MFSAICSSHAQKKQYTINSLCRYIWPCTGVYPFSSSYFVHSTNPLFFIISYKRNFRISYLQKQANFIALPSIWFRKYPHIPTSKYKCYITRESFYVPFWSFIPIRTWCMKRLEILEAKYSDKSTILRLFPKMLFSFCTWNNPLLNQSTPNRDWSNLFGCKFFGTIWSNWYFRVSRSIFNQRENSETRLSSDWEVYEDNNNAEETNFEKFHTQKLERLMDPTQGSMINPCLSEILTAITQWGQGWGKLESNHTQFNHTQFNHDLISLV